MTYSIYRKNIVDQSEELLQVVDNKEQAENIVTQHNMFNIVFRLVIKETK